MPGAQRRRRQVAYRWKECAVKSVIDHHKTPKVPIYPVANLSRDEFTLNCQGDIQYLVEWEHGSPQTSPTWVHENDAK